MKTTSNFSVANLEKRLKANPDFGVNAANSGNEVQIEIENGIGNTEGKLVSAVETTADDAAASEASITEAEVEANAS